jgi:prepilin-type N-terminal cleavage/methylation domain-containing protein
VLIREDDINFTLGKHMKNTLSPYRGFTLIELAIVIVIIISVALFVIPTYANYVKRAKVTESLRLAMSAKTAVNHHATDDVPLTSIWTPPTKTAVVTDISIYTTDTTGISLSSHGELLNNLPVRHSGEIVIAFSSKIAPVSRNELILSPRQSDSSRYSSNGHELPLDFDRHSSVPPIIWECNSANPPEVNLGTRGTLNGKLAPANCRA